MMGNSVGAAALAVLAALGGSGHAPAGNAAFVRQGAQVYAQDAVGVGCRTLGLCSGAVGELRAATPRYLSLRAGEPVVVTCRSGDLVGVTGFFGRGDELVEGWAAAAELRMREMGAPPRCGAV